MTSFYNFYEYVFGEIVIANANIIIMSLGLIIPLYMLVFGLYFYFYADTNITKINKFIFASSLAFMIAGSVCVILKNNNIYKIFFWLAQSVEFLHASLGYILLVLGGMMMYGCFKYKY